MTSTKRSIAMGATTITAGLLALGGLVVGGVAVASPAQAATPTVHSAKALTDGVRTIVQVIGNDQHIDQNHTFPQGLAVRAIDAAGNGVPGDPVTFTIQPVSAPDTMGTASFPNGAQSVTVTSDVDGYAHIDPAATPLTAQGVGDLMILATTPGVATPVQFPETVTAPSALITYLSGAGQTGYARQSFAAPVVARITDEYGAPITSVPVTFTLLTTKNQTGSAIFPNGTNTTEVSSSGSGVVSTPTINAGATPGTVTLETCAGAHDCSVTDLTIVDAPPASAVASSGDGQTAAVNASFADPLAVRVLDAGLNPVEGTVLVHFSISGAPAQFAGGSSSLNVPIAADGTATAPALIAGPLAGSVTVRATVVGSTIAPISFQEAIG